jgi:two-component system KDP operon response regulator KdpE
MVAPASANAAVTASPRAHCVLLVDDDAGIRSNVRSTLSSLTDTFLEAGSVAECIRVAQEGNPDLIVLDLGLPDGDGLDAVKAIRLFSTVPIIVLSGRESEEDKVALLDAGADDFVTKPFQNAELAARVRSNLRRAQMLERSADERRIEAPPIIIDLLRRSVTRDGDDVRLTPTEWTLLKTLVQHSGRTLTHKQLWEMVWEREFGDPQLHLRVHVTHLRRKIEPDPSSPRLIVTEPGVGYRFELPQ